MEFFPYKLGEETYEAVPHEKWAITDRKARVEVARAKLDGIVMKDERANYFHPGFGLGVNSQFDGPLGKTGYLLSKAQNVKQRMKDFKGDVVFNPEQLGLYEALVKYARKHGHTGKAKIKAYVAGDLDAIAGVGLTDQGEGYFFNNFKFKKQLGNMAGGEYEANKLYAIVHELTHYLMNHVGSPNSPMKERQLEMFVAKFAEHYLKQYKNAGNMKQEAKMEMMRAYRTMMKIAKSRIGQVNRNYGSRLELAVKEGVKKGLKGQALEKYVANETAKYTGKKGKVHNMNDYRKSGKYHKNSTSKGSAKGRMLKMSNYKARSSSPKKVQGRNAAAKRSAKKAAKKAA